MPRVGSAVNIHSARAYSRQMLRALMAVVVLAGCGPLPPAPGFDGGFVQAVGNACPEATRGTGACSLDAGQILECGDAGWTVLFDCTWNSSAQNPTPNGRDTCTIDDQTVDGGALAVVISCR